MPADLSTVVNLGIGGFAIWIMYQMSKSAAIVAEKKDAQYKDMLEKKDEKMLLEIDKRDKKLESNDKAFRDFMAKSIETQNLHINENSKALNQFTISIQENTRVTQRLWEHLTEHVSGTNFTQVNVEGKDK